MDPMFIELMTKFWRKVWYYTQSNNETCNHTCRL